MNIAIAQDTLDLPRNRDHVIYSIPTESTPLETAALISCRVCGESEANDTTGVLLRDVCECKGWHGII